MGQKEHTQLEKIICNLVFGIKQIILNEEQIDTERETMRNTRGYEGHYKKIQHIAHCVACGRKY